MVDLHFGLLYIWIKSVEILIYLSDFFSSSVTTSQVCAQASITYLFRVPKAHKSFLARN